MVVDLEVLQMGLFPGEVQVSHGAPEGNGRVDPIQNELNPNSPKMVSADQATDSRKKPPYYCKSWSVLQQQHCASAHCASFLITQ
jgi:hypothetical protein